MIPLFQKAIQHKDNEAIIAGHKSYSYDSLNHRSDLFASVLLDGIEDLNEARVGFMIGPGFDYVVIQWAIWKAGGIAVPLCLTHPLPSLQYVIEDTGASIIVLSSTFVPLLKDLAAEKNIRLLIVDEMMLPDNNILLPDIGINRRAMILYTSGTTNKPKGVVSTHKNLNAQISTLVEAWKWSTEDHILCVLPLHHVHGIVNVISCAMYSGATCEFIPEFSPEVIFDLFLQGRQTIFMAVPTIYFKLISFWESLSKERQEALYHTMKSFRLMVCGSAALPVTVMDKWKQISGHTLLERYGMTEMAMAISNPYVGERRAGYVGIPIPGVQIKLADEKHRAVPLGEPGEILVKGDNVFQEYWNKPDATIESFTNDGWFKTGDIAVVEDVYYRIMGRNSVDIIKSGGYKISALEIEEVLRMHPQVVDCAIVGIPDEEWGELVVAAIVANQTSLDTNLINGWLRERIASYKTPRKYLILQELPRNAMGKVTKNDIKKLFE